MNQPDEKAKALKAYCTSRRCSSARYENISKHAVKDVSKNTVDCPDCGSVLLWRKENTRNFVKDVVHTRNKPKASNESE